MKQHKQNTTRTAADRLYALFLHLYPPEHRQTYGPLMLQAFKDSYRDAQETDGRIGIRFWLDVVRDEAKSIGGEHIAVLRKNAQTVKKSFFRIAFGISLLLLLSFLVRGPRAPFLIGIALLLGSFFFVKRSSQEDTQPLMETKNTWMQQGLLYGAILGVFLIILNVLNTLVPINSSLQNIVWALAVILFPLSTPLACGLAGFASARKSHTARAGTLAGVFTAVMSSAIMIGSLMLIMFVFWNTVRYNALQDPNMIGDFHHRNHETFDQFLWEDNLGGATFSTLLSLFYGGILGTIGGLFGARTETMTK
jgi:hypothetical protein